MNQNPYNNMKLTADILQELSMYVQVNYEDDWYLQEKVNELKEKLYENMKLLNMDGCYRERALNSGFSCGEKKRNEILQLAMLEPTLGVLDETYSGLGVDSIRIVASGINSVRDTGRSIILITHNGRLLDYIKPDIVYVRSAGRGIR